MNELKYIIESNAGNFVISVIAGVLAGYVISAVTGKSKLSALLGFGIAAITFIMIY